MANSMGAGQTYEFRVDGPISDQLMAALGVPAVEEPVQTLLLTPPIDQGGLLGLIDRVSAFGLELVEIRRISTSDQHSSDHVHAPDAGRPVASRHCYELSVRGVLGPTLITALTGLCGASARRSNSWTFRSSAPHGLAALMQALASHRAKIISFNRIGYGVEMSSETRQLRRLI
jgi:hypothetical protein